MGNGETLGVLELAYLQAVDLCYKVICLNKSIILQQLYSAICVLHLHPPFSLPTISVLLQIFEADSPYLFTSKWFSLIKSATNQIKPARPLIATSQNWPDHTSAASKTSIDSHVPLLRHCSRAAEWLHTQPPHPVSGQSQSF